jgi:cytochrome P450
LVDEVKRIPEDHASFLRTNYERFQGHYTGIGAFTLDEGIAALRNDLARNLDKVLRDLQDEASYALDKEIGDCHTWIEATLYRSVLEIVARVSARTLVGMPLCRDDAWIAATNNLSTDIIRTMYAITSFSPWVRPFVVPFLRQYRKLIWYNFFFRSKLKPQVTTILDGYKKTNFVSREAIPAEAILHEKVAKENKNLVHWIIGNFKDPARVSIGQIGRIEYGLAFAAIHTTSSALTHVLFDLAAHPDYAEILREEIDAVVAEENHPQGRLLKTSISKLKKLDSFIKESQRVNPIQLSSLRFPVSSGYTSNVAV